MIEGTVNAAYEAALVLSVEGPEGHQREIEAVVDTGYNGFLTLPSVLVGETRPPVRHQRRGDVGRRQRSQLRHPHGHRRLGWSGRHVEAYAAETTPLVGMRLLAGHDLHVEVENGGRVVIQARWGGRDSGSSRQPQRLSPVARDSRTDGGIPPYAGYRANSRSKVVLPTVKSGPPDSTILDGRQYPSVEHTRHWFT